MCLCVCVCEFVCVFCVIRLESDNMVEGLVVCVCGVCMCARCTSSVCAYVYVCMYVCVCVCVYVCVCAYTDHLDRQTQRECQ